jgi:hypothetical protein
MIIFNDFKKLWRDNKGIIEGMIEVEVVSIKHYGQCEEVTLKIYLKDNEGTKLLTFGSRKLFEGDTMALSGLKISIEAKLETIIKNKARKEGEENERA